MRYANEVARQHPYLMHKYGKTVYMDGSFDVLHIGHVDTLTRCRDSVVCKKFIVGIMSDEAIKDYKRTPILAASERAAMVNALACVDEVIVDAPYMNGLDAEFISKHNIDVIMYGGDPKLQDPLTTWKEHYAVPIEQNILRLVSYSEKQSTTAILKKILEHTDIQIE